MTRRRTIVRGRFNQALRPTLPVTVSGNSQTMKIEAVVDTAFNGDLSVPTSIGVALGLQLKTLVQVELGDGSKKKELVFTAQVQMGNREFPKAEILLSDSDEPLLGDGLLQDRELRIDYANREVTLWPAPRG